VPYPRNGPRAFAAAVAAALALPAAASAHVTLQPSTAPADGFTRLDVRVPNERDDASTVKVDVRLPPGFAFVSYEPQPGWKVTVRREKLDEPIEVEGGFEVDEQVARITWSGGRIGPGQFVDFGLSLRMPNGEAGEKLTFKALQTYDDGDVVRWIGPEDAEEPAPVVTLAAAGSGGGHGAPGSDTAVSSSDDAAGAAENASAPAETSTADSGGDGLAIAALVVAVLALAAAAVAAFRPRRKEPA
jgi:periplasmic copper chaperone A